MKIAEMLKREEFYKINAETLSSYYGGEGENTPLYVYPGLNAIVTKRPSKKVREYLLTEYGVRGNFLKRFAVRSYVRLCLASGGIMADRTVTLPNKATADTLIYPCNRKYRIFNFDSRTVDVQIKSGFPSEQLRHEIEFRTREGIPGFVPLLVSHCDSGYSENIIDGRPLARITDGFEKYKQKAYNELSVYARQFDSVITGKEYSERMRAKIEGYGYECSRLTDNLCLAVSGIPEIKITFSHGDLQAGNIWIENGTGKVYIIDWESWGMRSEFYDKAALFDGLRPGNIENYFGKNIPVCEKAVVLLEDLVFQIEEYRSLPDGFGKEKLEDYIRKVTEWSLSIPDLQV